MGILLEPPETRLGMVPEYECREAAVYAQTPWLEWTEMPAAERAASVAHYRMHLMIDSHINDAQEKESDRKSRNRSRRAR